MLEDMIHAGSEATIASLTNQDAELKQLLEGAYGYAVFPAMHRSRAAFGGARGQGEVFEQGKPTGFATLTEKAVGVQIGGRTFSELLVFNNKEALEEVKRGKAKVGALVSAVVVKAGATGTSDFQAVVEKAYSRGGVPLEPLLGERQFTFHEHLPGTKDEAVQRLEDDQVPRADPAVEPRQDTGSGVPVPRVVSGALKALPGSARKLVGKVARAATNPARKAGVKRVALALAAKNYTQLLGKPFRLLRRKFVERKSVAAPEAKPLESKTPDVEAQRRSAPGGPERDVVEGRAGAQAGAVQPEPAASERKTAAEVGAEQGKAGTTEAAPLLATAVISRTELARLVASITPFRMTIDEGRGRWFTLGRPTLELVSGRGIRLRGSAVVSWDFAHVPVQVTVNRWQLLFVPRVRSSSGAHVLSLDPVLEELDVKSVAGLVDAKVAASIRHLVTEHQNSLAWSFGRTLATRLPLPANVSPKSTFAIFPAGGEASVDEREVRLVLRFKAQFEVATELEQRVAAAPEGAVESASEKVSPAVHAPPTPRLGHALPRPPPARSRILVRPPRFRAGR